MFSRRVSAPRNSCRKASAFALRHASVLRASASSAAALPRIASCSPSVMSPNIDRPKAHFNERRLVKVRRPGLGISTASRHGLIGLGLLLTLLLVAFGAFADDRRIAGDALEVGKVYILQDRTPQYPPRKLRRVRGDMILPAYTPIEVLRRTMHKGRPWYWTRWIRPRTLDRSRDSKGWIDSAELVAGVVLSP